MYRIRAPAGGDLTGSSAAARTACWPSTDQVEERLFALHVEYTSLATPSASAMSSIRVCRNPCAMNMEVPPRRASTIDFWNGGP